LYAYAVLRVLLFALLGKDAFILLLSLFWCFLSQSAFMFISRIKVLCCI